MAGIEDDARKLFEAYSRRSNEAIRPGAGIDPAAFASVFAPFFVGVSPAGVFGAPKGGDFVQRMADGFANYRAMGATRFEIVNMEFEALDELNGLVKADWEFDYKRPSDSKTGTIAFRNIYFVTIAGGAATIFAWITPDEQKALREHGLIR